MQMPFNVLLIGGHGKISQLLTPLLLAKAWNVTSIIRTPEQKATIEALGKGQPGQLSVLVSSVADINTESDAKKIIDHVKPDFVVWSAGAGGKGGPDNTNAIDRDAAIAFTRASVMEKNVKKFLTVSYLASRRGRPSWWSDRDWEAAHKLNTEVLPTYYEAKVLADEVLAVLAKDRNDEEARKDLPLNQQFCGISLRPGTLTDEKVGGVAMGKLGVGGKTSRATVANAILAILETDGVKGWVDIIDGDDAINAAVGKFSQDGVDSMDEEDLGAMKRNVVNL